MDKNKIEFDELISANIIEKFESERIRKNNDSQLFTILSLRSSETHYSKTLKYLLNFMYFNGDEQRYEKLFLKLFYEHVLHREIPKLDFEKIQVVTEYIIKNDKQSRYIDLVIIEANGELIPIEVKIYSGDQDKQLHDYYNATRQGNESFIYYLTINGKRPTKASIFEMDETKIKCISFKKTISTWAKLCLETIASDNQKDSTVVSLLQNLLLWDKKEENGMKDLENILNQKGGVEALFDIKNKMDQFGAYYKGILINELYAHIVNKKLLNNYNNNIQWIGTQSNESLPKLVKSDESGKITYFNDIGLFLPIKTVELEVDKISLNIGMYICVRRSLYSGIGLVVQEENVRFYTKESKTKIFKISKLESIYNDLFEKQIDNNVDAELQAENAYRYYALNNQDPINFNNQDKLVKLHYRMKPDNKDEFLDELSKTLEDHYDNIAAIIKELEAKGSIQFD